MRGAAETLRCACSMSASFLARISSQSCAAGGSATLSADEAAGKGHNPGTQGAESLPEHRTRSCEAAHAVRQREARASSRRRRVAGQCNMVMLHDGATCYTTVQHVARRCTKVRSACSPQCARTESFLLVATSSVSSDCACPRCSATARSRACKIGGKCVATECVSLLQPSAARCRNLVRRVAATSASHVAPVVVQVV